MSRETGPVFPGKDAGLQTPEKRRSFDQIVVLYHHRCQDLSRHIRLYCPRLSRGDWPKDVLLVVHARENCDAFPNRQARALRERLSLALMCSSNPRGPFQRPWQVSLATAVVWLQFPKSRASLAQLSCTPILRFRPARIHCHTSTTILTACSAYVAVLLTRYREHRARGIVSQYESR